MTTIKLKTHINAPASYVFQLSRDIDLHQESVSATREKAIGGRTSGLIQLGETVTFRARHFGFWLQHTSKITEMDIPYSFTDEMTEGQFKSFSHKHLVEESGEQTILHDELCYETPYGILGRLFDKCLLHRHMVRFLKLRNAFLKSKAESFT